MKKVLLFLVFTLLAGCSLTESGDESGTQYGAGLSGAAALPYSAVLGRLYFRGTPNNWGTTAMSLVANNTWEVVATFGAATNERFKFDVNGDWTKNYGDNNRDGVCELSGADIPAPANKTYVVRFNDSTLAWNMILKTADFKANITYAVTGYTGSPAFLTNAKPRLSRDGVYQRDLTITDPAAPKSTLSNLDVGYYTVTVTATNGTTVYTGSGSFSVSSTNTNVSVQMNLSAGGSYTSVYGRMGIRGTCNSWAVTSMALVSNYTWQAVVTFGAASDERFKFDVNGDWATNFGDNNADGIAEMTGADIRVLSAGTYRITFNDQNRSYTLVKEGTNTNSVYKKTFPQVYFRGTPNNWAGTVMTLVSDYTWKLDVKFGASAAERFKFDVNSNWVSNYGDANRDGNCELSGGDITMPAYSDGTVFFNDQTKRWWFIEKQIGSLTTRINYRNGALGECAGRTVAIYRNGTFYTNAVIGPDGVVSLSSLPAGRYLQLMDAPWSVYRIQGRSGFTIEVTNCHITNSLRAVKLDSQFQALATNLSNIAVNNWVQSSVDYANGMFFNTAYTATDWENFFSVFFPSHLFSEYLSFYLQHPAVYWGSYESKAAMQQGLMAALTNVIDDNMRAEGRYLGADLASGTLLSTNQFHYHRFLNILINKGSLGDTHKAGLSAFFTAQVNAWPLIWKSGVTLPTNTMNRLATIRAQLYMDMLDVLPLTAARKTELSSILGLTGAYANIFSLFTLLVIDNNGFSAAQLSVISNHLSKYPADMHNLRLITQNDLLGNPGWKLFTESKYGVNIFNIEPGALYENGFPSDAPVVNADLFTLVLAHEVNHVVDVCAVQNNSALLNFKQQLIAKATNINREYLRSIVCDSVGSDFFVVNPQEFFASIANMYFADTRNTLRTAVIRYRAGQIQPLNQFLFFVETYSRGGYSVPFYKIDLAGTTTRQDMTLTRGAYGRITSITVDGAVHSFGYNTFTGDYTLTGSPY